MIEDLIAQLDESLRTSRADYYAKLNPGVADAELNAFAAKFGVQLPASFRTFYKWRNGQHVRCFKGLHENYMFSSLEDIEETKDALDPMIGHDFKDPGWWRREWVPFLSNGGGDHLCLDLSTTGDTAGKVIEFCHEDADRNVAFENFDAWLSEVVADCE